MLQRRLGSKGLGKGVFLGLGVLQSHETSEGLFMDMDPVPLFLVLTRLLAASPDAFWLDLCNKNRPVGGAGRGYLMS